MTTPAVGAVLVGPKSATTLVAEASPVGPNSLITRAVGAILVGSKLVKTPAVEVIPVELRSVTILVVEASLVGLKLVTTPAAGLKSVTTPAAEVSLVELKSVTTPAAEAMQVLKFQQHGPLSQTIASPIEALGTAATVMITTGIVKLSAEMEVMSIGHNLMTTIYHANI